MSVAPATSPARSATSRHESGGSSPFPSESGRNWGAEAEPPPPRPPAATWALFAFVSLVRLCSFLFLLFLAVVHLFLEDLFGVNAAGIFPLWRPGLVAAVFVALAAVNLALFVRLARRQLAVRTRPRPPHGLDAYCCHQWYWRWLRLRRRYTTLCTWLDDRVGLRGVWFSELMLVAEALEISTQTYALFALADAGMGRTGLLVFAALLTGNLCVSALLHLSSDVRVHRDWLVVADTAFDFAFAVAFPVGMAAAFVAYVLSCEGFVSDWDRIVESLNLAGTFLVQEPAELLVKLVPFLSAHLLMSAVWDATEKEQLSQSKKWQVRRRALAAARSPRWLRALVLLLSVGASAALLTLVAARTRDRCGGGETRFCARERYSLTSTACMCEVVDPGCDAALGARDMADFVAEVEAHAAHVRAVAGDRCGLAELPPTFAALTDLWYLGAAHGNLTDAGVGALAGMRSAVAVTLDFNRLTQIPRVHPSAPLAQLWLGSNAIAHPRADVDDFRDSGLSLRLDSNPLAELPCAYGELGIVALQVQNTGLNELLPAGCAASGWRESLAWLAAGENNISALPVDFVVGELEHVHLGGNPLCSASLPLALASFDGVCEPSCAPACAEWMGDDDFCEEQCDVEACAWDHGECPSTC